jgi:hypothetical protein
LSITDPVESGRKGALRRWGPPGTRTVKLGDLTPEQRRLVILLVEAAKEANQTDEGREVAGDAA